MGCGGAFFRMPRLLLVFHCALLHAQAPHIYWQEDLLYYPRRTCGVPTVAFTGSSRLAIVDSAAVAK